MSGEAQPSFVDLLDALDPKEQRFVDAYLECLNATLAARRVYGVEAAKQKGYKLLQRPDVAAAIKAGLEDQRARANVEPDRIIGELILAAFADPRDLFDENDALLPLSKMPAEIRRTIAAIKVRHIKNSPAVLVEYKLVDKARALELLGKRLKMWTDRKEIGADESLVALLQAAFNRPKPQQ